MPRFALTPFGRLRRVSGTPRFPNSQWLFECPCGQWIPLTFKMLRGQESIDHASDGCTAGYHETHNFVAHIIVDVNDAQLLVDAAQGAQLVVGYGESDA